MVIVFAVSLKGFGYVPFIFFPDSDRNMVTVDINLPLGTNIEKTLAVVGKIEEHIMQNLKVGENRQKGIVDWSSYIGEGPESYDLGYSADESNSSYAHILVNTSSGDDNADIIQDLDSFCFDTFPNADIRVSLLAPGRGAERRWKSAYSAKTKRSCTLLPRKPKTFSARFPAQRTSWTTGAPSCSSSSSISTVPKRRNPG